MIIPMLKYSFLIYHREYDEFLKKLQDLGVLHIHWRPTGEDNETLRELFRKMNQLDKIIRLLKKRQPGESAPVSFENAFALADEIAALLEERDTIRIRKQQIKKDTDSLEPWGDFDWKSLERLAEAGIQTAFFICPARRFQPEWNEKYHIAEISNVNGQLHFVVFYKPGEEILIEADRPRLPHRSLSELRREMEMLEQREAEIEKRLDEAVQGMPLLENAYREIASEYQYYMARQAGTPQASDKVVVLEGYVPADRESKLTEYLQSTPVFYFREEVDPADRNVPILLRNNKFARLFEPIGKLFSLPAYHELDLTPFFAPFFMLFFGFCLGDAGYGLLILIAATLFKKRLKPEMRSLVTLAQFLGAATVLMGIVTGTFFGLNLLDTGYTITAHSLEVFRQQNIPAEILEKMTSLVNQHFSARDEYIAALQNTLGPEALDKYKGILTRYAESDYRFINYFRFIMLDSMGIFTLSLILGAIQIVFGMCLRAANLIIQKGFKYALSTFGWIWIILSIAFFMLGSKAGWFSQEAVKPFMYACLGAGAVLVFFFNNPDKNVFARVGLGIWDSYGVVTGIFGDLLSYIRLFALAMSSSILGFVFNAISLQLLNIPYIGWLFFILLLAAGHTLNLLLSALGSFVHPMRLTFVEFYKNAGFAGGGKEYKPFSKLSTNT